MNRQHRLILDNLYRTHKTAVFRYISYLTRSDDDRDDLFQETWLRVARNMDKLKNIGNARAWIFTIAANLFKDMLRKRRVSEDPGRMERIYLKEDQEKKNGIKYHDPEGYLMDAETGELVRAALKKLPDKLQKVFILREMEGFSHPEIGGILRIPVGTAKTRYHRAVLKLRREMRKRIPVSEIKCEDT